MKKTVLLIGLLLVALLVLAACGKSTEDTAKPEPADIAATSPKETSTEDTAKPEPADIAATSPKETYTVTFNTNGGGEIPAQSVQNGKRINKPDDPVKADYKFVKWTYQGEEWSFAGYTVTGDMTLEAVWAPIWYTITYQIGKESSISQTHYTYSVETPDFTIPDASNENYDFTGWTWEGQTEPVKNPVIPKGSRGDRVFTANWTPMTFTITYDLAGGTMANNPNPTTYTIESADITLTGTPTWENHVFLGWQFITENGVYKGTTLAQGSSGDKTAYALWGSYLVSGHTITGWETTAYEYSLEIPASINGVSITAIGKDVFKQKYGLKKVTISNGIQRIEEGAFQWCEFMKEITIPDSVTSIGEKAFSYCSGLTSIHIPNSVTSIGNWAFNGCSGLTSITIPEKVTSLGDYTFDFCSNLTSVTIPKSVTSFGVDLFSQCSALKNIYYNGTKAQWNAISKGLFWNADTGNYTVHCTDGDIAK